MVKKRMFGCFIAGICLLPAAFHVTASVGAPAEKTADGYVMLFNGKNFNGWELISRTNDKKLLDQIFDRTDNGDVHIFGELPDKYGTQNNRNSSHAMMFSEKFYSRYSLKFEYKWGKKTYNNFNQYQYDAGCCYHIQEEKIWPWALEYQIRYDHTTDRNHTGDIWNNKIPFQWFAGPDNTYLPFAEGGRPKQPHGGEHLARTDAVFHGLDGEWNQCEIIVMGKHYVIYKLNGQVVNMLLNLKYGEGTIGFQAETAEIYYRNIMIKEFDEDIPAEVFLDEASTKGDSDGK